MSPITRRRWSRRLPVALLAGALVVLAATAARRKSPTIDEPHHLLAGYAAWRLGDHRLNPTNGVLPKRWAALGLLLDPPALPDRTQPAWLRPRQWRLAQELLYERGNDAMALVWRGRLMIGLLGGGLGLIVFAASRRLFGWRGGLVSLGLCAFSPSVLAHAGLVTSDLAAAAAFTAAVVTLWAVLQRVTWRRLALSVLALSALALSKFSVVLVAPMALALGAVRIASGRPLPVRVGPPRRPTGRLRLLGAVAGLAAVLALGVVVAVWVAYDLRYAAAPPEAPAEAGFVEPWAPMLAAAGPRAEVVRVARDARLLPEAYLYGLARTLKGLSGRRAYLGGRVSLVGFPEFFIYAYAVKTPLSTLALLVVAAAAGLGRIGRSRRRLGRALYRTAPLWVLLLVYGGAAVSSQVNIGHRHILPLYPALFVLAGAAARSRWSRRAAAGLLVLLAVETLVVWPDYLAYFNPLAGGSDQGWRHLVDSSLDWGQDLPALAEWLEREAGDEPVYLSYFGIARPAAHGIEATLLPSYANAVGPRAPPPLEGGVYCVSASVLVSVYGPAPGPWAAPYEARYREAQREVRAFLGADPEVRRRLVAERGPERWRRLLRGYESLRVARLCAALRRREPDGRAGGSILIYRLDDEEAARAVDGPPAELAPAVAVEGLR